MVEHTVQNDPNASLAGFLTEQGKVLFRSQHGINFPVVRRVVAMIGGRLKNGVYINCRD
jgi:hypothetical protein